jgi:hypothetical protein
MAGLALGHYVAAQADQSYCLVRDWHAVNAAQLGLRRLLGPDRQIEVELVEGGDCPPSPPMEQFSVIA